MPLFSKFRQTFYCNFSPDKISSNDAKQESNLLPLWLMLQKNAKWLKQLLSPHKVYEKEAIFNYETKTKIHFSKVEANFMLFITMVQKSKSISKDWFYLLNEIKSNKANNHKYSVS